MGAIERLSGLLLWLLAFVGALGILALMTHVACDILLRNLANAPVPATYEIVTHYYMITLAFIPLAWVERSGGMVAVEVLDGLLGRRLLHVSDIFVSIFSTVVYAALFWVTWQIALKNFNTGTFVMAQNTRVPTWPAYFLPPVGFVLAAVVTTLRGLGQLRRHWTQP